MEFRNSFGLTRRDFLARVGMGMGLISAGALAQDESPSPLAPHAPHFAPKAKRVVHFFLNGGPSHVDTFDPKPMLAKYAGQPLPGEYLRTERKTGAAFPTPFNTRRSSSTAANGSSSTTRPRRRAPTFP